MKKLSFTLYVTNAQELITGLDLVKNVDLKITGHRLIAGEGIKLPILPKDFKGVAVIAKLDSLFNDIFLLDSLKSNILLQGEEGIMFIGDSDTVLEFAKSIKAGKTGLCAETIKVDGFPRAFWSSDNKDLFIDLLHFLDPEKPDPDGKPEDEASAAEPKPADKPAAKPAKKPGAKPAAKPAKKPGAKPAAAESVAEPAEEKAPEKEPFAVATNARSLEELFVLTAPDTEGDADAAEDAVTACKRMCKAEGIVYNLAEADDEDLNADV